jgi:hypothetical protein
MPEFVASLLAAAAFCLTLLALNALTRVLIQTHLTPSDLGESGFLQIGAACCWRGWRTVERLSAGPSDGSRAEAAPER